MKKNSGTLKQLWESIVSAVPNLEEGIPDKVTAKDLREALEAYAQADKNWKDLYERRDLAAKEDAGDHLYRLTKALLRNRGFYTYRDAMVDNMFDESQAPNPEDFD